MRILVIDDDAGMTDLLTILLTPVSSEVLIANSAAEGIQKFRAGTPDVIILDLLLSDMDGYQVCKAIRAESDVPIIILSSVDSPGMVARALDSGADDFLTKPVSSGTLIARINKIVRRPVLQKKNQPLTEMPA